MQECGTSPEIRTVARALGILETLISEGSRISDDPDGLLTSGDLLST